MIYDYKTKWTDYDLRISVYGNMQMYNLAYSIEHMFYEDGYRKDLYEQIFEIDPETKFTKGHTSTSLREELKRLGGLNEV